MPETDDAGRGVDRRADVRVRGRRRLAGATAGLAAAGVVGTGVLAYSAHAADVTAGTTRPATRPSVTTGPTRAGNDLGGSGSSGSTVQPPAATNQPPAATDQPPMTTSSGS